MSKRTILLGAALGFCVALSGCGGSSTDADAAPNSNVPATVESNASDAGEESATLNVEDAESPEGVVDAFFRSFFKGDDDGAFALLTSKAQEATREQFSAQASDTIKWRATKKAALDDGRVCVYVEVEDYTETGEIQVEELTFILSNADGVWRVAGFNVGDLAIDFEDRRMNAVAQDDEFSANDEPPVRVGQANDSVVR